MKGVVIIFAKAPRMGLSKTRLAAGIGATQAWRIKRALDARTCRVARDPRWSTRLAVAPEKDLKARFPGAWPDGLARLGQGRGDLGRRMARALATFGAGAGGRPVLIIGSDAPDLRATDLDRAFAALRRADIVFGPAVDGGFWLIGAGPRLARRLTLRPVRWSSPHALADTLLTLPVGARVARLRTLADVDDAASLRAAGGGGGGRRRR